MTEVTCTSEMESNDSCTHVWDLSHDGRKGIGYRCARCGSFIEVQDVRGFQSNLRPEIDEAELTAFLHDVEKGLVELRALSEPSGSYLGRVEYRASNGWRVVVFSDSGNWDYFDRIESDDGRLVTLTTMPKAIQRYRPDRPVARARYALAG